LFSAKNSKEIIIVIFRGANKLGTRIRDALLVEEEIVRIPMKKASRFIRLPGKRAVRWGSQTVKN